jgi:pantothenate kinase
MDGFHLSNRRLAELGLRDNKGLPATFDADAYIDLIARAKDPSFTGPYPVYDRAAHEPVWWDAPGQRVEPSHRVVMTEGNYLLLADAPWSRLENILDQAWLLDAPVALAKERLIARHIRGGRTGVDAETHYRRTDLPNTVLVNARSRQPTLRLRWSDP